MRNLSLASSVVAAAIFSLPTFAQSGGAAGKSLTGVWFRISETRGFPMSQWSTNELMAVRVAVGAGDSV